MPAALTQKAFYHLGLVLFINFVVVDLCGGPLGWNRCYAALFVLFEIGLFYYELAFFVFLAFIVSLDLLIL